MNEAQEEGLKHLKELQEKCFELEAQNKQLYKQLQDKDKQYTALLVKIRDIEIQLGVFTYGGESPLDNAIKDLNDTISRLQRYKKEYLKCIKYGQAAQHLLEYLSKGII
jgi:hypothetical protein